MSLARTAVSSPSAVFQVAVSASRRIPSFRCPQCLHRLPTNSYARETRRRLQTVTAHRPTNIEPPPPPPRNIGITDTSIVGRGPETEVSRQPRAANDLQSRSASLSDQPLRNSLSESDVQRSKSTNSASLPNSDTGSEPRPSSTKSARPKLRPRKAAMHLTPTAVTQLRDLLDHPEPKFIRVGVKNRGCSGLAYHLEYVEKPGKFDEAVEQDGVKVLIDSKALFSIIGSEMDWVEDKLNQRFVFRNPNISKWNAHCTKTSSGILS